MWTAVAVVCTAATVAGYALLSGLSPGWTSAILALAAGGLKKQPGQDIVVTGSIRLCHTLIEADLVDEYRLFVYPVVQGRGRRLFPDGFELPELRLLEAKAFHSGIAYLRYARP